VKEKSKSKPDSERVIGKPDPDTIAYYKKMRRLDAESLEDWLDDFKKQIELWRDDVK